MATKIFNIKKTHRNRSYVYSGTLKNLIECFSYTLDCGHSYNYKISTNPKTFNSLLSNLEKSVRETQGSCWEQDYYDEATEADITEAKVNNCFHMCLEDN